MTQSRRGERTIDQLLLTTLLPLVGFALLTAANAFFVAAEFALVTVDRVEIDRRAEAGDRRARTVRKALRELSFQLSGAQLGITITALLTGYLAEPALSRLFQPALEPIAGDATEGIAHALRISLDLLDVQAIEKKRKPNATSALLTSAIAIDGERRAHAKKSKPHGRSNAAKAKREESQRLLDSFKAGEIVPAGTFTRLGPYLLHGYLKKKGEGYIRTDKPFEV